MTHIRLTTPIAAPPELCFDLTLNVDVQLSLDRRVRAVNGTTSGPLQLGDEVTWRARYLGWRWRMTSKIVEVDRPRRFVDEMQRGPFARWRHVHEFEPTPKGTRMHDDLHFAAPLGLLGSIVDAIVLRRYITALLTARNRRLKKIAESKAQGK